MQHHLLLKNNQMHTPHTLLLHMHNLQFLYFHHRILHSPLGFRLHRRMFLPPLMYTYQYRLHTLPLHIRTFQSPYFHHHILHPQSQDHHHKWVDRLRHHTKNPLRFHILQNIHPPHLYFHHHTLHPFGFQHPHMHPFSSHFQVEGL